MKALKVFTTAFAVLAQLALVAAPAFATGGETRKLLVTAYYSPLPNQTFYIKGSYEADIRLNGRGTNGADGTEVYEGMIAAPKTYPFGTRVSIPGLGVGEVHDRGGAILAHKDYDRIDVWMGRGEEGLARALNWGARMVYGDVYFNADQIEPGLSYLSVSSDLPASVLNRLRANSVVVQNPQNIDKPISQSSSVDEIKELQTALTTLGYYSGPVTGNFGPLTKEAVLYFQLSEGIVDSPDSVGAGTYGPKTRTTLTAKLETHNEVLVSEKERLMENFEVLAVGLGKNSTGDDVVNLQRMLWELGYYRGSLTGEYDEATMEAVFNFQQKEGILDSEWERGAGYFGKKTYAAMEEAIEEKAKRVAAYPMQAQTWVPAARPLPKIASLSVPEIAFSKQSIVFSADLVNKNIVQAVALEKTLDLNDRNEDVIKLQNILIEGGYLAAGLNTGYYGEKTQQAVLRFQMEQGIVSAATDSGAGRVGPRTLEALNHV